VKHARNYIDRDFDLGIVWCVATVVSQQKLGLLPEWRAGTGPLDHRHSSGSRPDLNHA
jgi:hypothetical protein